MKIRSKKLLYAIALSLMPGFVIADVDDRRWKRWWEPKWKVAVDDLQKQIDDLQAQIDNIQLIPGPQGEVGPMGPQGPKGAPGDDAPNHTEQLCQVYQGLIESGRSGFTEMPDFCGPVPPKVVFVTSETYTGDLGGVVGADAKCQALADREGLKGVFKAWLATSTDTSPAVRFTRSVSPYTLVDGTTVVASSWDDLVDGFLSHPIDLDESGMLVARKVWTNVIPTTGTAQYHGSRELRFCFGTDSCGTHRPMGLFTCEMFTTSASGHGGAVGHSFRVSWWWSAAGRNGCDQSNGLYCVQQ